VGLTTLPPSCTSCVKFLGVSASWSTGRQSRPGQGNSACIMDLLFVVLTPISERSDCCQIVTRNDFHALWCTVNAVYNGTAAGHFHPPPPHPLQEGLV
jgi:hypothetical protein